MVGVGTYFSLDTLMTGKWRRFRGFVLNLDKKLWLRWWMTNFFGQRQRWRLFCELNVQGFAG